MGRNSHDQGVIPRAVLATNPASEVPDIGSGNSSASNMKRSSDGSNANSVDLSSLPDGI